MHKWYIKLLRMQHLNCVQKNATSKSDRYRWCSFYTAPPPARLGQTVRFSRSGNQATRWVDYSELTAPHVYLRSYLAHTAYSLCMSEYLQMRIYIHVKMELWKPCCTTKWNLFHCPNKSCHPCDKKTNPLLSSFSFIKHIYTCINTLGMCNAITSVNSIHPSFFVPCVPLQGLPDIRGRMIYQ